MPPPAALAILAGLKSGSSNPLARASATCSKQLQNGRIDNFSRCVAEQVNSFAGTSRRSTARRMSGTTGGSQMAKRNIGALSRACSAKNGYTTKADRKSCFKAKAQFHGRRRKHRR